MNGERNGKGKEYNEYGQLIFEGEYLFNKKWNGKLYDIETNNSYEIKDGSYIKKKYYENGKLKSEEEYFDEKLNGKYKEYYENSELKFEGEYLNGKRNGKYKEYYENGKLKSEGEYIDKKLNRKFKEYYENGELKFEGEYLNGKRK